MALAEEYSNCSSSGLPKQDTMDWVTYKQLKFISHCSRVSLGKSKVKMWAGSVFGEDPLPVHVSSLCPHREGEMRGLSMASHNYKGTSPIQLILIPSSWGLGLNVWSCGEGGHPDMQPIAVTLSQITSFCQSALLMEYSACELSVCGGGEGEGHCLRLPGWF